MTVGKAKGTASWLSIRPTGYAKVELGESHVSPEMLFPRLNPKPHESLLLSGGEHPLNQYSFIGLDPHVILYSSKRQTVIKSGRSTGFLKGEPLTLLRMVLDHYRLEPDLDIPHFWSGGIGYLAYELGRYIEELPSHAEDDLNLPELYFVFYRHILCYKKDEKTYTLYLLRFDGTGAGSKGGVLGRVNNAVGHACREQAFEKNSLPLRIQSNFTKEEYLKAVETVINYIIEGDIYQANLSQRFHTPYNGDPYGLFLRLFQINPAPFFAYLNPGTFQIMCSSPERFLRVNGSWVETRPIKGTMPRGLVPEEDLCYAAQLVKSEKNGAELAMITDLLRNDLGRVCEYGTVKVEEAKRLEAYTNVYHLVSIITGRLRKERDRIDLIRATFPGGSITGCPKIRSMEIIDELEPTARGVYTGSIGYLGLDGSMDLNIAIRTLVKKGRHLYYHVGGGIVYDSNPEEEYEETLHKAASMRQAIESTRCA